MLSKILSLYLFIHSHFLVNVIRCSPNIIFIIGDDHGINDMMSEATDTLTPNINRLASQGVILSHYYVQNQCSPSRSAFMSGRLPYRINMQMTLKEQAALSLTRQVSLISEEFKAAGYDTHAIGKWHLGYQSMEYTPTFRGYDTFYGYYNSEVDYFTSNAETVLDGTVYEFRDVRNNLETVTLDGDEADYSIYRFRDRAEEIINDYADCGSEACSPFFLYLAFQSSHVPSQAPGKYIDLYDVPNGQIMKTEERICNQAQTTSMDDAIGDIVTVLKSNNMWHNTLLVFSSDNGAPFICGDNFPLRGQKHTQFEGGYRVPAFINGGYLNDDIRGTTFGSDDSFVHIVDWYPTLLEAAGIDISYAKSTRKMETDYTPEWETADYVIPLDGVSIWKEINGGDISGDLKQRVMILDVIPYGEDYADMNGTVRMGKWKYIKGLGVAEDDANIANDDVLPYLWGTEWANIAAVEADISNAFGCDLSTVPTNELCFYTERGCLFNIKNDPCEFTDLSGAYPYIFSKLEKKLQNVAAVLPSWFAGDYELTSESEYDWLPDEGGFWGPFMNYKEVGFEEQLYADLQVIYGSNNEYTETEPATEYTVDFGNDLEPVTSILSNSYFIVDIDRDDTWLQYLSSTRKYHNYLLGPQRDDHVNWKEWIVGLENIDIESFIVSPDCSVCDEDHILNALYPLSSAYYMTPVANGCTQLPIGRIACDMDYNTYECNICSTDGKEHSGYWVSETVYNGLNNIDETTVFDEVAESDDWRYGFCGFTIRDALAAQTLPNAFSECKRSNHITCTTDEILPKRKPSLGTNGAFCMCVKPANLDGIEMSAMPVIETEDENEIIDVDVDADAETEATYLYQSDFEHGTYRITEAGKYVLMEDIIFDFNAPTEYNDNYNDAWWPDERLGNDPDYYKGIGKLSGPYFMGFWAGITIECDDVHLDLNGFSVSQSLEFYYQQSFFVNIALSSQYFLPTQGPAPFGTDVTFATNTIIENGVVGLSSHHGIFGHFNENLLIRNIEVKDFMTHGIQLNGFHGVELRDISIHDNKYHSLLSPYYTHMRMLRKAHKLIAEEDIVADECVTFHGRDECVTMADLVNDVDILLDLSFKYAISEADYDPLSDDTVDVYSKQLWSDNMDYLVTEHPQIGTVYGIFLNYIGANVIAWYTGSDAVKSSDVLLHNIEIYDLYHRGLEAIGFHQGTDKSTDRNAQRILNMLNAPINALHVFGARQMEYISMCNNYAGYKEYDECSADNFKVHYVGNKIIDIQVMAYHLINKFDLSWNYCYGGAADMSDLTRFAVTDRPFWPYSPILVGSADAMIHPGKGLIGIRFNGVNGIELNNIHIHNFHSHTQIGSTLPGAYTNNGHEQAPYQWGYTVNRVRGISMTMCQDVDIRNDVDIHHLVSDTGLVWAISVWFNANIHINDNSNINIYNLFAGNAISAPSLLLDDKIETAPNLTPEVCAFKLYDDETFAVTVDKDESANINIECIFGYIGCQQTQYIFTNYGEVNAECQNEAAAAEDMKVKTHSYAGTKQRGFAVVVIISIVLMLVAMLWAYNWRNIKLANINTVATGGEVNEYMPLLTVK